MIEILITFCHILFVDIFSFFNFSLLFFCCFFLGFMLNYTWAVDKFWLWFAYAIDCRLHFLLEKPIKNQVTQNHLTDYLLLIILPFFSVWFCRTQIFSMLLSKSKELVKLKEKKRWYQKFKIFKRYRGEKCEK